MSSKLDLSMVFHQMELHPDLHDVTTFAGLDGLCRNRWLFFGFNMAKEKFKQPIWQILKDCPGANYLHDRWCESSWAWPQGAWWKPWQTNAQVWKAWTDPYLWKLCHWSKEHGLHGRSAHGVGAAGLQEESESNCWYTETPKSTRSENLAHFRERDLCGCSNPAPSRSSSRPRCPVRAQNMPAACPVKPHQWQSHPNKLIKHLQRTTLQLVRQAVTSGDWRRLSGTMYNALAKLHLTHCLDCPQLSSWWVDGSMINFQEQPF